jgi:sphingolipid 4-desaturase/C4-monooxygenase
MPPKAAKIAAADSGRPRRTVVPDGSEHPPNVDRDTTDFLWLMTEEPHRSRRKAILKAHPEVR